MIKFNLVRVPLSSRDTENGMKLLNALGAEGYRAVASGIHSLEMVVLLQKEEMDTPSISTTIVRAPRRKDAEAISETKSEK